MCVNLLQQQQETEESTLHKIEAFILRVLGHFLGGSSSRTGWYVLWTWLLERQLQGPPLESLNPLKCNVLLQTCLQGDWGVVSLADLLMFMFLSKIVGFISRNPYVGHKIGCPPSQSLQGYGSTPGCPNIHINSYSWSQSWAFSCCFPWLLPLLESLCH